MALAEQKIITIGGGKTCKNTWLWQVNKQTFWLSSKIRKCYQQSGKRTFFLNDIWTKPSIEIFRRQDKNKTGKSDVCKFFWSRDIWHSEISECMWRFRKNKEEKLVFRQQHLMKYHQLSMYKPKENKTNEISKIKIYTLDISCILVPADYQNMSISSKSAIQNRYLCIALILD